MSGESSLGNTATKLIPNNDDIESLSVCLEGIKEEILEDSTMDEKDLSLQLEVKPLEENINKYTGKNRGEDGARSKYPIDNPGCSSWIDSSKKVTLESGGSDLRLLEGNHFKKEPPDVEVKQEKSSSNDDSYLSVPDVKLSIENDTLVPEIKSEEVDLDLQDAEQFKMESDLSGPSATSHIVPADKSVRLQNGDLKNSEGTEEQEKISHCQNQHIAPKHKSIESDIDLLKCEHCEYKTNRRSSLNQHIINKHKSLDEVNVFQCTFCEYKAKLKANLKSHIINKHKSFTQIELFKCDHCEFKTKTKRGITSHILYKHKSFDEVKIFQCTICEYKSKSKSTLKTHIKHRHKSFDEVDVFHCMFCEYKSKSKSTLKQHTTYRHKSIHEVEVFHCTFCKYKSKYKSNMKQHIISRHESFDKVDVSSVP